MANDFLEVLLYKQLLLFTYRFVLIVVSLSHHMFSEHRPFKSSKNSYLAVRSVQLIMVEATVKCYCVFN